MLDWKSELLWRTLALATVAGPQYTLPNVGVSAPPAVPGQATAPALARADLKEAQVLSLAAGSLVLSFGYDENGLGRIFAVQAKHATRALLATFPTHDPEIELSFLRRVPATLLAYRIGENPQGPLYGVMLKYSLDLSGRTATRRETYIETLVLRNLQVVARSPRQRIAAEDHVLMKSAQTGDQWRDVDSRAWDAGKLKPARRSEARILLRDVNGDGAPDIVVWKREYVAHPDRGREWAKTRESLWVARFDPKARTLGKLVADKRLPLPPESLWREAP